MWTKNYFKAANSKKTHFLFADNHENTNFALVKQMRRLRRQLKNMIDNNAQFFYFYFYYFTSPKKWSR